MAPEQLHAGALAPLAVHGGVLGRVDLPVGREAAEMVEADDVEQRHIALHAPDPPGVAGLFVRRPVIDRIAPELAGRGIVVGRHAGNELGAEVGLQLEQLGMRPDVGRVGGNIDRDVADDLDALLLCVRTQRVPLSEEDILEENAEVDLAAQLLGHSCERLRPAVADVLLRPHIDRRVVVLLLLERHEQRVIGQPFAVLLGEVRDSAFISGVTREYALRNSSQRVSASCSKSAASGEALKSPERTSSAVSRPYSTSRSMSIRYGLPAAAEKHWYGESPKPV